MISVVLALYNGERYIAEQLLSILNQTISNIEIIIVNDKSEDNSLKIVKDVFSQEQFTNFQIIENERNLGVNKSFEIGVKASSGEYIAFSDQDDVWLPNKLEILSEVLQKNSHLDLVFAPSLILKGDKHKGKLYPPKREFKKDFFKFFINQMRGASSLVRKTFLLDVMPFPSEDIYDKWIYFISVYLENNKYIDQPLDFYRVHDANIVGTALKYRPKKDVIRSLESKILFYKTFQNNIIQNKNYKQSSTLNAIEEILIFLNSLLACLNSRSYRRCMKFLTEFILNSEFSLKEKLIYSYYFIIK